VGWVDAFGISSAIDAGKRDVARAFVEFVTSWPAYKSVLEPEWPTPARYLLPAVKLADGQEPLSPTLYPALYEAYGSRLILSAQGLNDLLMSRGRTVDCLLPPERDDNEWQQKCRK